MPLLHDMDDEVGRLTSQAQQSGEALDDAKCTEFMRVVHGWPMTGAEIVDRMVAMLRSITSPRALAATKWLAILNDVRAEIGERLAYDRDLLKRYQARVASAEQIPEGPLAPEAPSRGADRLERINRTLDSAR